MPSICAGCGEAPGEFQCPLCQAAELDGGYFCSQPCFAKSFRAHRDSIHPGGVVRAKRSTADKIKDEEQLQKRRTQKKRALEVDVPVSAAAAQKEADDQPADFADEGEVFSDEEEEAVYQAALAKELVKRKELSVWPVWPGVETTGDAIVFGTATLRSAVLHIADPAASVAAAGPSSSPSPPSRPAWTRSDVGIASDDVEANLHSAALFAVQTAANWRTHFARLDVPAHAVIVAGSATSAHAAGWAARCRGVSAAVVAGRDEGTRTVAPDVLLADLKDPIARAVVVVAYQALGDDVDSAQARVAQWLAAGPPQSKGLLVVLPDVLVDPDDLQSLSCPSVVVRKLSALPTPAQTTTTTGASPAGRTSAGAKKAGTTTTIIASTDSAVPGTIPALPNAEPLVAADFEPSGACYSVSLSTTLVVRGDLEAAVATVSRIYSDSKPRAEDHLIGALMADWGCPSAVHAHHKLAVLLRLLVDTSVKMSTMTHVKDQQSLSYIAARCVVRAAKHLPRLDDQTLQELGVPCALPYLDATIAYCFGRIPKSITDELTEAWGLQKLGVIGSLGHEDRLRQVALHRLRSIFQPRLGVTPASFAGVLHHCIADASLRHSLSVKDVRTATLWDWTCEGQFGDLHLFLAAAQLVHKAEDMTSKSGFARDGTKMSRTQRNKKPVESGFVVEQSIVQQHPTSTCKKIRRLQWPLLGARRRRRELMSRAALEELLSALPPSRNVPMYVGDVGNFIGRWTTFNNRFGGYLPPTLMQFLEQHPEEFRIVGNLVTRVKNSLTQQIKLRFDNDDDAGIDSDEERRRKRNRAEDKDKKKKKISLADIRTRRGLQAAEKKLIESKNMSKRGAKKRMKQLRNRARFDRNRKQMDSSAKVPGFSKPKAKALKGRGRKANARTWKRGSSGSS
jgi:hypothetical protein